MATTGEQVQPTQQGAATPAEDPYRFGWRYVLQPDAKGNLVRVQQPLTREDVLYPQEEDFIVQNDGHDIDCVYLRGALRVAVRDRPSYKVMHDHRIDWQRGGVRPLGPDLTVVADVTLPWDPTRGTFPIVDMGATPVLVVEVASPTTRNNDLHIKVDLYYRAGVPFYAIVDSWEEAGQRSVQVFAYRATAEGYLFIPPNAEGRVWLPGVNLWLAAEGGRAVCYTEAGERLPDIEDAVDAIQGLQTRTEELQNLAEEAITARQEAEKRASDEARQREEAEKRASDEARQREEAERRATDEARQREEAEKRALDLASRMADLEAELRRARGEG